jgi:hypothetical protein
VRKAIKRAIDEISRASPVVGWHLSIRIETGAVCRYRMESGPPPGPLAGTLGRACPWWVLRTDTAALDDGRRGLPRLFSRIQGKASHFHRRQTRIVALNQGPNDERVTRPRLHLRAEVLISIGLRWSWRLWALLFEVPLHHMG